jgi:hypothetical protein
MSPLFRSRDIEDGNGRMATQVQERAEANRREVAQWRQRIKKQRMQVLLAQELDDEVQVCIS